MSDVQQYRLASLLLAVSVIALIAAIVVVPRRTDEIAQRRFGSDGSISSSTLTRFPRSWMDVIAHTPGFVEQVSLLGYDPNIQQQVDSLWQFRHVRELHAHSVGDISLPNGTRELESLRVLSFSYCSAEFVEGILAVAPSIRDIEIWNCSDVQDRHLAGLRKCKSLRRISVDGSETNGTFLQGLAKDSQLQELTLHYSPLDQNGVDAIASCCSLTALSIMSSDKRVSLMPLNLLCNLEALDLVGFENNGDEIERLRDSSTALQVDWR